VAERLDAVNAARLLADWGFRAHSGLPSGSGDSFLLIAIRRQPTDLHFDPERVTYWMPQHGRGIPCEIDVETPTPLRSRFAWGTIEIADRLRVRNEWVTFGGDLEASMIDDAIVCVFQSDAPILRRGGHSQGWEHGAASLAAFFGRIKVAVDFVPGFEAQLTAATPRVFFASFLGDLDDRYRDATGMRDVHPELWSLVRDESSKMRALEPETWAARLDLRIAGRLST
jgi:hypothetical protein